MKYLIKWTSLVMAFMGVFMLQSCDNGDSEPTYVALVTAVVPQEGAISFKTDDQKTYHIGETLLGTLQMEDGDRAVIRFSYLKEAVQGYNYNIKLRGLNKILTKDVVDLTAENKDEIGNDKLLLLKDYSSLTKGYFNAQIQFPQGSTTPKVNLVVNKINVAEEGDYTVLELRLNNNGTTTSSSMSGGVVCFKLGDLDPTITGKKGLKILVNTINKEEVQEYTFDKATEN